MIDFRIWQIAGWTMLHYLWVGAVLGILAAAVRLLLRSRGANLRYLAALGCFAALAIAPLPIAVVVTGHIPPPPQSEPLVAAERAPDPTPLPSLPAIEETPEATPPAPAIVSRPIPPPVPSPGELLRSALDRAAMGLPWLWLIGAPLTFLLTTIGLLGAERLRRQSRLLEDSPIAETCRRLAAALSISRRVSVAICDRIAAPVLLGIFCPLILLPAVAVSGWDPQQLEMVLLHELAHVRRFDNLVNLLQRIVESLLFFHPLVWFVSAWVRREREHCCDEVVVARTRQPRAYAEMLVNLSERVSLGASRSSLPAHAQVASPMAQRPLVARIRQILNKEEQSMKVSSKTVGLVFAGVIGVAVVIGGYCSRAGHAEDGPAASTVQVKPTAPKTNDPSDKPSAAKPDGEKRPAAVPSNTGKVVDKTAAEIMRKLYLSREWIEKARSFRIHSDYKGTPTAEGLRRPEAGGYSKPGKPDPRAWCMKDEWAWDESHILYRSQSHYDGDTQANVDTRAWNGSLAIRCWVPERPDQYAISNKAGQFFEHVNLLALLPWGPGDGYRFWWLPRDAVISREANFTAPEDFELAGQEDVQGKRCHVLQSRAGLVRLYVGVADGRLYRREILVSHEGAARQLAICQKIGGASIKTLKDWWNWEQDLKPQDRIRAYRSFQEAQFERARVTLRQTFDDYREVAPGCWLSYRQRMDSYETDSAEPVLDSHAEQTISDVAINQPLPQDLFHIDLPEGAQVVADWRYDPPIHYTYRKDQTEAERVALRDALRPPGYHPTSETLKAPEGAVKKPEAKSEPAAKANDPAGKPSAAKPAEESPPASGASAPNGGAKTESKPVGPHSPTAAPNTRTAEEEVRRLAAAYITNRDSFRQLECTYELRLLAPGKEDDIFRDRTKPVATATGLLVRDGSTVRTEVTVSDKDLEQSFKDNRIAFPPRAWLLDNERGITYSKIINGGVLYSSAYPPEKGGSLTPFSFGRFTGTDEQFHPGAIIEYPKLRFSAKRFDGKVPKEPYAAAESSELIGIEYSQKLGSKVLKLQFFLAPAKGYLPIISRSYLDGKPYQKSVITDVRRVGNDRAYPMRSLNFQCGPGGQVGVVTETRVTKLRVDEPVDPSRLQITVPTGALIRNAADDNSQFKVPHGGLVGIKDLDAYFELAAKQSKQEALRALGFRPNSETLKRPEGAVKKPEAKSEPAAKANDPSVKPSAAKPADEAPRN